MPALTIAGRTYSQLPIPENYQVVEDQLVPRDGESVHMRRYQPKELPQEAIGREHITVVYRDDGFLYTYNALTQPLTGALPCLDAAWDHAEKIWQDVNPDYRQQLERLRTLGNQTRSYTNAAGKKVTIPILWAKYANKVVEGSYEWIGLGPGNTVVEFECHNLWDYAAGREQTEMWYSDTWILARRGLGPQLQPPLAKA
ncbi:hypothetical protein [Lacticaseibacillus camelliae]|nr:hypothetical protein [Lacticaseibacillus camelliae]